MASFLVAALALALLATLLIPRLLRLKQERRQRRGDEHYRKQLQAATDHAITTAVRARLAEPVINLHIVPPMRVSVGDVVARALEDFALEVLRDHAAAMLRHRLEFRGHACWPDLITDAFGDTGRPQP
ncbi:hypothetical protein AB0E27_41275 [Streptomyces sparsogenes]|uniref:hypothetical protein n=1 Tax=Streptomyces sparsogenes TaxID=67365 RepID=UPI0033C26312